MQQRKRARMLVDMQIEDSSSGGAVSVCASGVPAVAVVVTTGVCAATIKSLQELADEHFDERMYQKWVKKR